STATCPRRARVWCQKPLPNRPRAQCQAQERACVLMVLVFRSSRILAAAFDADLRNQREISKINNSRAASGFMVERFKSTARMSHRTHFDHLRQVVAQQVLDAMAQGRRR